jgi:methylthioribose-1-phosphate isomerase
MRFGQLRYRTLRSLGFARAGAWEEMQARYWTQNQLGDPQCIWNAVREWVTTSPYTWTVTGHSHMPGLVEVTPGRFYVNTGSWTFQSSQYAYWDGSASRCATGSRAASSTTARTDRSSTAFEHLGVDDWWRENCHGVSGSARRGRRLRARWRIDPGRRPGRDVRRRFRATNGTEMRSRKAFRTVWLEGSVVRMIDQPLLPHRFAIADMVTAEDRPRDQTMVVRGAPSGDGVVARARRSRPDRDFAAAVRRAADMLGATRPTAQSLFYGIRTVLRRSSPDRASPAGAGAAVAAARGVADGDARSCGRSARRGGRAPEGCARLPHCNMGWLAFVDWGSALSRLQGHRHGGAVRLRRRDAAARPGCAAHRVGLQGEGIPHAVIADNATGALMARGKIDIVIVGADRIARNGDVANKIGTYSNRLREGERRSPYYVAAPTATIDSDCPDGTHGIPIEGATPRRFSTRGGSPMTASSSASAPRPRRARRSTRVRRDAGGKYIAGIITERGIVPATEEGARANHAPLLRIRLRSRTTPCVG